MNNRNCIGNKTGSKQKNKTNLNILPILTQWKSATRGKKRKEEKTKREREESVEEVESHSAGVILHHCDDTDSDGNELDNVSGH